MENNHLSTPSNQSRSEELANCHGDAECRSEVRKKYQQEYDEVQERIKTCTGADQCVAIAKELRALQNDYIARASELQEKFRAHGAGSLTAAETHEWVQLRGAISNIEGSRDLVIYRAQMTGGSEETSREIANIMGSAGIASAGGIAGGISKGGKAGVNAAGKGSAMPIPTPTKATNGLVYQSNGKHTPGQAGYNRNAGTEPANSIQLFGKSVENGKKRYALDKQGNVHQFTNTNDGSWHWSGSTGDASVPLKKSDIPNAVKKEFGLPGKWR